jgi:hypothetical protein
MRIFLTSSHFSTILMTAYARNTAGDGNDFLVLDVGRRKLSNIKQMQLAASLHDWKGIIDFSEILADEDEALPGITKRITWRIRNLPGFRQVYKILLRNYLEKLNRKRREELEKRIGHTDKNTVVRLFLLKETGLNDALAMLYKNSIVSYFEHGLSDYLLMIDNPPIENGKFYCVFADGFKRYLEKRNIPSDYVSSFADEFSFRKICDDYFNRQPEQAALLQSICIPGKVLAFILLQPFENIRVNSHCWEGFLDQCIKVMEGQTDIHYIIKPHPLQSGKETGLIESHLKKRGIQFTITKEDASATSTELAFSIWKKNTAYVFSPYSSALFYLSALFPDEQTKYYFAYEYMRPYLREAPSAYYTLYDTAGPMIKEVFSEKCAEI